MEPRGGIFLCEPDGETLQLTAHLGLPPEFVAREERIRMGECLCGMVAQTGEMIYAEKGCDDPRHTRNNSHLGGSHIVVPIKSRGIVLGVIFLYPAKSFSLKPSRIDDKTLFAELAFLPHYRRVSPDNVYYYAVPAPPARIEGLVIHGVPPAAMAASADASLP
jgi:hypothetical protein